MLGGEKEYIHLIENTFIHMIDIDRYIDIIMTPESSSLVGKYHILKSVFQKKQFYRLH